MRLRARIDDNQKQITNALRRMGASVQPIHFIGKGVPDLLVGYHKKNFLFEIKDGSKVISARKLTPGEIEWHERWRGDVVIIESVDDALKVLNGQF